MTTTATTPATHCLLPATHLHQWWHCGHVTTPPTTMLATCHLLLIACSLLPEACISSRTSGSSNGSSNGNGHRLEGIVPLSPAEETYGFATVCSKLWVLYIYPCIFMMKPYPSLYGYGQGFRTGG